MPFDETSAHRFRACLKKHDGITEKKMMGGLCFLLNGNMLGGVDTKDGENRFMFRVGKENEAKLLKRKGARPAILGERKMGGLIFVSERECDGDALKAWIKDAMDFAGSLPNK